MQPCTFGTQNPPDALPVQQLAAESVAPAPGTQQTPASQAAPPQQSIEMQEVPAGAQGVWVEVAPLLPLLLALPLEEPPMELLLPPLLPLLLPELAFSVEPLELLPATVLRPPLDEDECEPPEELPPPLTGMLFPVLGQEEIARPMAPSPPSNARQTRAERFSRSLRSPRAMPLSSSAQSVDTLA